VRAKAVARRRQLVLVGVFAGLLVVVAMVYLSGGTKRSRDCRDFDGATARYDQAVTSGVDPADEQLAALREEVERLRVACTRSGG
jgi:hypothetical protein